MAFKPNLAFVTVMDVTVYADESVNHDGSGWAEQGTLDCLTISNISQEGPRKEARGGLNATPCVRYGKTMRLEMEDVVMRASVLNAFFDADVDSTTSPTEISFTETFAKGLILAGTTYVVDKATGDRDTAYIVFYNFLPDSVTNITMESEGDIGMITLAGELFANSDGKFFTIRDSGAYSVAADGTIS